MEELSLSILIIDDDSVDRQMLKRTLAATDLTVSIEETASAGAAAELLKSKTYDVALLDYKLPDGTAVSVLKSLKDARTAQTPIIVLTVHAQKSIALDVLQEGAQDFLPKDQINADNLERAIRYSIQRNRLFQELQWSKERERRERELRAFQESVTEFDTAPLPTIRESAFTFEQIVGDYEQALKKTVEVSAFNAAQEVPDRMRKLANQLGELNAGPKDVVDIHATALLKCTGTKISKSKEEALAAEGRILLVQLMGYLCGYYRSRMLSTTADAKKSKKA